MRPAIVGIMGAGDASAQTLEEAHWMGEMLAMRGLVTLTGGRNAGVMAAASAGARKHGGLTLGILPDADPGNAAPEVMLTICTGMGSARNNINILTADLIIALAREAGAGTVSEMALAVKAGKDVIVHLADPTTRAFLTGLDENRFYFTEKRANLEHCLSQRLHKVRPHYRPLPPVF